MKQTTYFKELDAFLIVFILSVIILSAPPLMRFLSHDSLLIGQEPYYHARIADEITKSGVLKQDNLVYGSRPYIPNLYHLTLTGFSYIFPLDFISKLMPLLFGILSIIFFYLILKEFKLDPIHRLVIPLLLVSSPVFIYTFAVSNPLSALIFLNLASFYLLLKEKYFFAAILLISTLFFGFLNAAVTLLLLLSFILIKPKKLNYKKIIFILLILIAISIIFYLPIYAKHGLPQRPAFIQKNILKNLVADLGSNGFSLFTLLLAIIGLIITWKNKYKFAVSYMTLLVLLVLMFYFDVAIYFSFIFSVLAGFAFIALLKMRWEIKQIKNWTILILILGLLFSTLSYLDRISDFPPDKDVVDSLIWLKENSQSGEIVFSHYSKGFWIQRIAQRPVVMDSKFGYTNANQRFKDSNELLYSRNLEKTKSLLNKYDVSYIFIDKEMKTGHIWTREKQGLLFLFRNSETFKNIYDNNQIEIWTYLKGDKT